MKQPPIGVAHIYLVKRVLVMSFLIELLRCRLQQTVEFRGVILVPPLLPDYLVSLNVKQLDRGLILVPGEGAKSVVLLHEWLLRVQALLVYRYIQRLREGRHEELQIQHLFLPYKVILLAVRLILALQNLNGKLFLVQLVR